MVHMLRESPHRETRTDTYRHMVYGDSPHRETRADTQSLTDTDRQRPDTGDQAPVSFREARIYTYRHRQTHAVLV